MMMERRISAIPLRKLIILAGALAAIAVCFLELERLQEVEERLDIEEHIDIERHFKVEERARRHLRVLRRKAKRAKQIDISKAS